MTLKTSKSLGPGLSNIRIGSRQRRSILIHLASPRALVPVARLLLVGTNCVHDDFDALFSKHDGKRESCDAEPAATFLIRLTRFGVSFDLSKNRFDLGNKIPAIPWPRSFQILRLVK